MDSSLFVTKYQEFANELLEVCPELYVTIRAAMALPDAEKKGRFRSEIVPVCDPKRSQKANPKHVLPGVELPDKTWTSFTQVTQKAIQEYLTVLSFSLMFDPFAEGAEGSDATEGFPGFGGMGAGWMEDAMKDMKSKMDGLDFAAMSEKLKGIFGSMFEGGGAAAAGAAGLGGDGGGFPSFPEKFLKGHIAKLAEDIMREFKPEEFGLSPEELEAANANPMKAFEMLSQLYTRNPTMIQTIMKRIAKKMQAKIQRGELRPSDLAAEAEELMKHFTENTQFVEVMEMLKKSFGFEDPEMARKTGNEGSARLSVARERLRKKLAAKKAAAAKK
jgi:hypothetical protein